MLQRRCCPSFEQLENTWNEFGENKLELQQIKEKTWKRDYRRVYKARASYGEKDYTNAKDLLKAVSKTWSQALGVGSK